jgi:hypothetical protein
MLNVVMLSVTNKPFMPSVFMLNVVMLSVVMLNVVAPDEHSSLLKSRINYISDKFYGTGPWCLMLTLFFASYK